MDPTIAATVIGVLMTVAFGAFAWLRSDMNARFDKSDARTDARFDKSDARTDARFERLEEKVDGLIMTLARTGQLTEPEDPDAAG